MISLGTDGFPKILKEEIISISKKLLQIIEKEGTLPNSFYKVSIILITKPDKDINFLWAQFSHL